MMSAACNLLGHGVSTARTLIGFCCTCPLCCRCLKKVSRVGPADESAAAPSDAPAAAPAAALAPAPVGAPASIAARAPASPPTPAASLRSQWPFIA
eukprot:TRINITY_DN83391_c0_g1_i1.p1 TRINITY_DN83391_c0_g1~~TRINITY_DN83391_c0_g1_i1.p1  ORF type:complete len:105 (+),score=6.58 TRINITY_DN83391_c0_g1_i1:29-316(+)